MWSQSYLSKGSFQVNIKNKYSSTAKTECGVRQGSILGPLLFLLYVNNMKQAINCDLHLYADGSCLVYQDHDVSIIGQNLNKSFSNIYDWFVDNKLSIHFGENKTKFGTKQKLYKTGSLDIRYGAIQIKHCHMVTYLGFVLGENLSRETMVLNVLSKINCRRRFLYRKLSQSLCRVLCNARI